MKLLLNQKGMSLLEVTVAGAVAIIIGYATMQMNVTNMKAAKSVEKRGEEAQIIGEIRSIMTSQDACSGTLAGLNATNSGTIAGYLQKPDGAGGTVNSVFTTGFQRGGVTIQDMYLSDSTNDPAADSDVTIVPNGGQGDTNLVISLDRGTNVTGARFITKRVKLRVVTQPASSNLGTCIASSSTGAASDAVQTSAADIDDAFIDVEDFGIGITDPQYPLDIDGDTQIANGGLILETPTGANPTTGIIYKDGDPASTVPGANIPFIHNFNYGDNGTVTTQGRNTFVGENAGNLTMGATATVSNQASDNTGFGFGSLTALTTGSRNIGIGPYTLTSITTQFDNIAIGSSAMRTATANGNIGIGGGALEITSGAGNVAIGGGALSKNTTGYQSIAIGGSALRDNTTGLYNIALGQNALTQNTTASFNIGIGRYALLSNFTGASNIAIGYDSMRNASGGSQNIALGDEAARYTTGSRNIAIGYHALNDNTTGRDNVAIGDIAMRDVPDGIHNVLVGQSAGSNMNTGASYNVGVGSSALRLTAAGVENTAVGSYALYSSGAGSVNESVAIGYRASYMSNADWNVAVGHEALFSAVTAVGNTAVGWHALRESTGGANTAVGYASLGNNTAGVNNVAVGNQTLKRVTTGKGNTAVGYAGVSLTTQDYNTFIGHFAGKSAQSAGNTAVGANAMEGQYDPETATGTPLTGTDNVAVGLDSLRLLTSGTGNTAAGHQSLSDCSTCGQNTAFGNRSLDALTTGNFNAAFGVNSMPYATTAFENVSLGNGSSFLLEDGFRNTAVGPQAMYRRKTGSHNVVIGYMAELGESAVTPPEGNDNVLIGSISAQHANGSNNNNTGVGRGALWRMDGADNNVAIGVSSLSANDFTGNYNTAIGDTALGGLITGEYNVALGRRAGWRRAGNVDLTDANYSIYIGEFAMASANGVTGEIVIGHSAIGQGSNSVQLGQSGVVTCGRVGSTTVHGACPSDRNLKEKINDVEFDEDVIDMFLGLRARTYVYKSEKDALTYGFVAQEVPKSLRGDKRVLPDPETGEDKEYMTVDYSKIKWLHFKASQETARRVVVLEEENEKLRRKLSSIEEKQEKMQMMLCELKPDFCD